MSAFLSIRATSSDAGGDLLSPGERGSNGSGQSLTSDRVYSVLFLVPKKNGGNEASNQPQGPQPVGRHPSLQNGGPAHPKRPAMAGRLASKDRLERCLPYSAHPSRAPMLPPVQSRRSKLPVHLPPPFRLACAPWAFTKVMKAISDPDQVMGNQDYHLHRRYPNTGGVSSASITTSGGANSHPGVYHQCQEVPTQEIEFLGMMVNSNTLLVSLPIDKRRQRPPGYSIRPCCQLAYCLTF